MCQKVNDTLTHTCTHTHMHAHTYAQIRRREERKEREKKKKGFIKRKWTYGKLHPTPYWNDATTKKTQHKTEKTREIITNDNKHQQWSNSNFYPMQKEINTHATCKYMTNENQGVHLCMHDRKLQSD